ncbi:hypothetical protein LTR93_011814 [Exophiala xenobiotica]|nr:hypothetical protein LTR93_011814 [Exophiala xenobiotica]
MHSVVWDTISNHDAMERSQKVADATVDPILRLVCTTRPCYITGSEDLLWTTGSWKKALQEEMLNAFLAHRNKFLENPCTLPYLGHGTQSIYRFVRGELRVPFYRGLDENMELPLNGSLGRPKRTIGSWISIIYEAVRDGRLAGEVMRTLENLLRGSEVETRA